MYVSGRRILKGEFIKKIEIEIYGIYGIYQYLIYWDLKIDFQL